MTGVLRTHMNKVGVTEIQYLTIVLCLCPISDTIYNLSSNELIMGITFTELLVYINAFV